MATVSNPYSMLHSKMESEQLIKEAHASKKNKKRNKNKASNGETNVQPPEVKPEDQKVAAKPDVVTQQAPQVRRPRAEDENMPLDDACPQLLRVATKDGRVGVWKDWIAQVKAGDRSVLYRARDGSLVNFHQALLDSGAFETTVAHIMRVVLQRNEQPMLATLLSSCLPGLKPLANELAASLTELSRAMRNSRPEVQDTCVSAIKALMLSLKSSSTATAAPGAPSVANLDKQLAPKRTRLERALAATSDLSQEAAINAIDVAKLLSQKFTVQREGRNPAVAVASEEIAKLTELLEQHRVSSQSHSAGRSQQSLQEIRYLDSKIEGLSSKVEMLAKELQMLEGELEQQMLRRANLLHVQTTSGNGKTPDTPSSAEYQHQLDCVHQLKMAAARASGAAPGVVDRQGELDATLQQLVLTCVQAAQIQDKFMESLMNRLQFARDRLQQAQRLRSLNDPYAACTSKPVVEATAMIEEIRQQSQATYDAALVLDGIVVQQERAIQPSAKDSVLRSQAMQVKQIVSQVVMHHYQLVRTAEAPLPYQAQQQQQVMSSQAMPQQQWQMDDILRMKVGDKDAPPRNGGVHHNNGMTAAAGPAKQTMQPLQQQAQPAHLAPELMPPMPAHYLPAGVPQQAMQAREQQQPQPLQELTPPQPQAPPPQPESAMDPDAQRAFESLAKLQASLGITGIMPSAPRGTAGGGRGRGGRTAGRGARAQRV